jgi:hypothetical protein
LIKPFHAFSQDTACPRVRSVSDPGAAGAALPAGPPEFSRGLSEQIDMQRNSTAPSPSALQLTLTWPEVLIDQIADAVAARLGDDERGTTRSPWFDVAGAAAYLDMSSAAVRKAAQRGLLPAHQPFGPGSRYFFHRRELDELIGGGSSESADGAAGSSV